MILIFTLPPEELKKPEQALDIFMERLSVDKKEWQLTHTEQGLVNGLRFVRARWSGMHTPTEYKMHGFNYLIVAGREVIQLSSQDVKPHHKEALRLAEASALTFKKR